MQDRDGGEIQTEQVERGAVERMGVQLGDGRILFLAVEDIAERSMYGGHGALGCVDGNARTLPEIEGAHIVQAHDVVGMRVREQDGIHAVDPGAQRLRAQIRRDVDQHVVPAVCQ